MHLLVEARGRSDSRGQQSSCAIIIQASTPQPPGCHHACHMGHSARQRAAVLCAPASARARLPNDRAPAAPPAPAPPRPVCGAMLANSPALSEAHSRALQSAMCRSNVEMVSCCASCDGTAVNSRDKYWSCASLHVEPRHPPVMRPGRGRSQQRRWPQPPPWWCPHACVATNRCGRGCGGRHTCIAVRMLMSCTCCR